MKNLLTKILFGLSIILLPFNCILADYNALGSSHFYLSGFGGAGEKNNSNWLGKADVLLPILLSNNSNLFLYGQGRIADKDQSYEDNTWMGSLGLGYRHILNVFNNPRIFGAYLLGDYSGAPSGHDYWTISPGLETLGQIWDFRINGYIPVGNQYWKHEGWYHSIGDNQYNEFYNNIWIDHLWERYEETGPGFDAEVGAKLFSIKHMPIKGFIGGYFFALDHNDDVVGGEARFTFQPTRSIELMVSYTYDNYQHSEVMAGLRLRLSSSLIKDMHDTEVDDQDIQSRLFDPIERNLGGIAQGNNGKVTRSDIQDEGQGTVTNNAHFFIPPISSTQSNNNIVYQDGTYEHPYIGFEQNMVNAHPGSANDPAYFMVEGGSGANPYMPNTGVDSGQITFNPYQYVLGRTDNFQDPASGTDRPVFASAFTLKTGDQLNNIILYANSSVAGAYNTGISLDNANQVLLDEVTVGDNSIDKGYKTGMNITNNSNVTLENSEIHAYDNDGGVTGINLENSTLNLNENNNNITGYVGTDTGDGIGVNAFLSTININGDSNSIHGQSANVSYDELTKGIDRTATGIIANRSTVNISGNYNSISSQAGDLGGSEGICGIQANINISGNNNIISGQTSGPDSDGIVVEDHTTINISGDNNSVSSLANGGTSHGIDTADRSDPADHSIITINISGNNNSISGQNNSSDYGSGIIAEYSVINLNGNRNTISGQAGAQLGTGINTSFSTVNIMGSHNTISGQAGDSSAYGIRAPDSIVNISGNDNNISGAATNSEARGIYGDTSVINISGSGNSIKLAENHALARG